MSIDDSNAAVHAVLDFHALKETNRDIFLLNYREEFRDYCLMDAQFSVVLDILRTQRDSTGATHVSLAPLLLLSQRQVRVAFDSMVSAQSYQAWVLVRPAVEATLIAGKWVDDPINAEIWTRRSEDPRAYRRVYEGSGLLSSSLRGAARLRDALTWINGELVHANQRYYDRHLAVRDSGTQMVTVGIEYFDDEAIQAASFYCFLYLILLLQDGWAGLMHSIFKRYSELNANLQSFADAYRERASRISSKSLEAAELLKRIGPWRCSNPDEAGAAPNS